MISIDTIAGTFDAESNVITPNLVDSIEGGTPILSVIVSSDSPVPEDGLIVNINTDLADITEFVAEPAFAPFTFGGEFLGAIYNSDGVATGFQVKLDNPRAVVNFTDVGLETEEVQEFTLSVEPGEGYSVSETEATSTVTVYDTLDQVPTTPTPATIGLSVDQTALIEGETATTLTFNVDGEIPPEGIIVSVDSGVRFAIGEFDLFNADITGGVFPVTNGNAGGFYFKITEPTASITLMAADDDVDPETGEVSSEGIETFTFALQEQAGYTIDNDAAAVNFTIADDDSSEIQVSLDTEPDILIEEEGTTAVFNLSLSSVPPAEGITVAVNSENLGEFDAAGLEVTGGEIVDVGVDGTLSILVTEQEATVSVPVADDGIEEGLETAVFTLVEPAADAGYQISADAEANQSSFMIYDTVNEAPVIVESEESDDTIATSIPIAINSERSSAIAQGEIDFDFRNNRDVDQTEDVDMYSVDLQAGDRLTLDLDSIPFENSDGFVLEGGGDLRIFNAAGEELAYNDAASAPGELLASGRDAYIDFTAETAKMARQLVSKPYSPVLTLLSPSPSVNEKWTTPTVQTPLNLA